ncbi:MAG: hypothetical protein K2W95_11060, partial [Candidatus Obscuribacterales bacterium]|nr:hypothetical protein [Candidatus Obscuribacterales bacterium]
PPPASAESPVSGGLNDLLADTTPPTPPPASAESPVSGGLNDLLADTTPPTPPTASAETPVSGGLNDLLVDTTPPTPQLSVSTASTSVDESPTVIEPEQTATEVEADGTPAFEEISFKRLKSMSLNELLAKLEEQSRTAQKRLQEILETHQIAFKDDIASLGGEEAREDINLGEELRKSRIELIERLRIAANSGIESIRNQTAEAKQSIEQQLSTGTLELDALSPLDSQAALFTELEVTSAAIETALQERLLKIVEEESKALDSLRAEKLLQLKSWAETTLETLAGNPAAECLPVTNHARDWLQNHSNTTIAKLTMLFSQEFDRILLNQAQQAEDVHQGISMAEEKIAQASEEIVTTQIRTAIAEAQSSLAQGSRELRTQLIKTIRQRAEDAIRAYDEPLLDARKEISDVEQLAVEVRSSVQDELQKSLDAKFTAYAEWLESMTTALRTDLGLSSQDGDSGERSDDRQVRLNKLASDVSQTATTLCADARASFKASLEESFREKDRLATETAEKHKTDVEAAVQNWRRRTEQSISTTSARLDDVRKKIQELHGQFLK